MGVFFFSMQKTAYELRISDWSSDVCSSDLIWREPRGREAGYLCPQFSIHRGRLQMILFEAARARLGPPRIRTDCRLVGFAQDGSRVTATFADRDGGTETATGDLLIGADGIHSAVRAALFPDESPPKWNGRILWRAVGEADPFLSRQ